jgi:hypothetical protein
MSLLATDGSRTAKALAALLLLGMWALPFALRRTRKDLPRRGSALTNWRCRSIPPSSPSMK